MSWDFLIWLSVFILQASLLGRTLFVVSAAAAAAHSGAREAEEGADCCRVLQLICLSDLEQDVINPYDLSSKLNRFVVGLIAPHTAHSVTPPA